MEILELENVFSWSLKKKKKKKEGTEERISELEARTIEITQSEPIKANILLKKLGNRDLGNYGTIRKEKIFCHWSPRKRE